MHRVLHPRPKPLREDPEKLRRYFVSTATRTLGTKPDSTHDLLDLVRSFPDQADELSTFVLRNVSKDEVLKEISLLRSDCSTGINQIPVKLASDYLFGPLTYTINSSINTSSFPKTWKTARVSPIPKVDNLVNEKDYRPFSILPNVSKIFERLVLNQILVFIEKQALLASSISGYRKGHSTTTVLMGITDDIIRAMKKGEVTLMVCADYSKAFDKVQFKAVLARLHEMGFSKSFLLLVPSYPSERRQLVQIDDNLSELAYVEFVVPQGSILGPGLFNLYVADLQKKLDCPCYQYADDTTFFLQGG